MKAHKTPYCKCCGHRLVAPCGEEKAFCPVCDDEVPVYRKFSCPECSAPIDCECVVGADISVSGKEERLYSCKKCGSAWCVTNDEESNGYSIERYFFG